LSFSVILFHPAYPFRKENPYRIKIKEITVKLANGSLGFCGFCWLSTFIAEVLATGATNYYPHIWCSNS
jgi:hypothetical protein